MALSELCTSGNIKTSLKKEEGTTKTLTCVKTGDRNWAAGSGGAGGQEEQPGALRGCAWRSHLEAVGVLCVITCNLLLVG